MLCFQEATEMILKKNSHLRGDEVAVCIGLEIVVSPCGDCDSISYITDILGICKVDLTEKEYLGGSNPEYAVRYYINRAIDEFKDKIKHNKLIEVLEADGYTKCLISIDRIQEVNGFAFDPQDKDYKESGNLYVYSMFR